MTNRDDTPTVRAPGSAGDDDDGLESRLLLARARAKLLGRGSTPVHLGRYRILDRLGQGGMGVVYLGQDDELDRKVAIKILRHDLAPSSAGRSRLLREAQATAKLSHPNVVHVYEVGHEADQVYLAMEYVAGDTLRRWNQTTRDWRDVVAMYVGAGEGLAAAHAVGLVHRDFKPDNVLVGRDGRPRVVDFGLARLDDVTTTRESTVGARDTAPRKSVDVTATAGFAGTPAYMAPELHAYHRADARSDQFAFCVSLFEALYGRRPFGGETITQIDEQVVLAPPVPIDPAQHAVPKAVHDAVLRGLARRPGERFASMGELLDELRRASARPRKRRWWPFGLFCLAALGLSALGGAQPGEAARSVTDLPDQGL